MGAGDVIHDFTHSRNKIFKGDDRKQRIKRALGAYYSTQHESVEDDSADALLGHKKISSSKKTPFTGSHKRVHSKVSDRVHALALKALEKQRVKK
jgi:hypothetical protein